MVHSYIDMQSSLFFNLFIFLSDLKGQCVMFDFPRA